MKYLLLFTYAVAFMSNSFSQNITGDWYGEIEVPGSPILIVLHLEKNDDGYLAKMDSPSQGAKGIPMSSTSVNGDTLEFSLSQAGLSYKGVLTNNEQIIGDFKQGGGTFILKFSRKKKSATALKRPQEPKGPFSYTGENVEFINESAKIKLAGTLTLPKEGKKFPVVILISGSGPQDRNEELLGHKPFLVLADHLTNNGIAVLRVDDRGVAESEGDFDSATTVDFATDVKAAVSYLKTRKEIDKKHIGLVGHSEGGVIAPMVAKDMKSIDFIVLLAGTGIRGAELLLMQQKLIHKANGMSDEDLKKIIETNEGVFNIIVDSKNKEESEMLLKDYLRPLLEKEPDSEIPAGKTREDVLQEEIAQITSPWMYYFLRHDPALVLEQVKCHVLAINGEKDLQVPAKENLEAIKSSLEKAKNKNVTTIEIPNLNHLFQECETGAPSEYIKIEQTFSPKALNIVSEWILEVVE